jgi:uncharacterized membrane protein YcaP (DUF421 family)
MDVYRIAIRAAFVFIVLLALLRLSGKRSVAQGSMLDFVVALVLGDLIDDAIWAEVAMSEFIIAASCLITVHLTLGSAAAVSTRIRHGVEGEPTTLMAEGEPIGKSLKDERISTTELSEFLRHQGLAREKWRHVRRAVLELSGEVSVDRHDPAKPLQKRDVA